jgi:hypothetical protein
MHQNFIIRVILTFTLLVSGSFAIYLHGLLFLVVVGAQVIYAFICVWIIIKYRCPDYLSHIQYHHAVLIISYVSFPFIVTYVNIIEQRGHVLQYKLDNTADYIYRSLSLATVCWWDIQVAGTWQNTHIPLNYLNLNLFAMTCTHT